MKITQILRSGLLLVLAVAAINPVFGQNSDPEALSILRKLRETYRTYKTMSMDFKLVIKDLENDMEEEKVGKLWLKGDKFKLSLDQQMIICDNTTIWTYLEDVNECQINFFEDDEELITPSKLFDLPESDFYATLGETEVSGDKKIQIIELTPIDKELSYHKIKVFVNLTDNLVSKGMILDKNGIHYSYYLDNFKSNPSLSDAMFTFDPSKIENCEIIDLR